MRIIHVLLGKANPDTMNGVNKVVHHLASAQRLAGHQVEVWGITPSPHVTRDVEGRYTLRLFPVTRTRFTLAAELSEGISRLTPDVWVQLHSVFIPEFWAIANRLHSQGVRFGLTPHGGYSRHVMRKGRVKKASFHALFGSSTLGKASLVHAIGASEVDDIRRLAPRANIVLVPNGQAPFGTRDQKLDALRLEEPTFAYCGRLDERHKGLDLLIQGFAAYRDQGGSGRLWLIGDGPDRGALEAMSRRLGVWDATRYHGAHFGLEKLALLRRADVFVHTSRWDVVPTAALEAAALGLPLLISRETNMAKEVGHYGAGIVLQHNTATDIADAMISIEGRLRRGEGPELKRAALHMIAERFSWPTIASALAGAYQAAQSQAGRES